MVKGPVPDVKERKKRKEKKKKKKKKGGGKGKGPLPDILVPTSLMEPMPGISLML